MPPASLEGFYSVICHANVSCSSSPTTCLLQLAAPRLTFTTSSCDLPSVTTTAMRFLAWPPLCDEGKTWSTANLMALPVCQTDEQSAVTSLHVVFSKRGPHQGRLQELACVFPPMYLTLRMACRSSDTLWCFPRGISSRGVSLYWTTPTCTGGGGLQTLCEAGGAAAASVALVDLQGSSAAAVHRSGQRSII